MSKLKFAFGFAFILVVLFSMGFVSATDLNLRITASVNGLSGEFKAATLSGASVGFDGNDVAVTPLPSNYISFFSNVTPDTNIGFNGQLSEDYWGANSNPRILTLAVFSNPAGSSSNIALSWSGANGFHAILKDYGNGLTRQTQVGSNINLSSSGSATITGFTGPYRAFTLEIRNTTASDSDLDTTPPGPVTNLDVKSKSTSSITWNWSNPTDLDFEGTILYFDGDNLVNASDGINQYTFSGLDPGTTYSLSVRTKDTAGNVNSNSVSKSGTTSGSSGADDGADDGGAGGDDGGADGGAGGGAGGSGGDGLGGDDGGAGGDESTGGTGFGTGSLNELAGKVGLTYGLIGLGVIILVVIIIMIVRILRNKKHKVQVHVTHSHHHITHYSHKKRI